MEGIQSTGQSKQKAYAVKQSYTVLQLKTYQHSISQLGRLEA